jgi:hypothetical protein
LVRTVLGTIAGIVTWMVAVTVVGFVVGQLWPELAAAGRNPPTLTTAMLATRLCISFAVSVLSGAVAAWIGRDGVTAALAAGVVLLIGWGIYHVTVIWHLFPVWYHLTFFVSLPFFSWLGARLARTRRTMATA